MARMAYLRRVKLWRRRKRRSDSAPSGLDPFDVRVTHAPEEAQPVGDRSRSLVGSAKPREASLPGARGEEADGLARKGVAPLTGPRGLRSPRGGGAGFSRFKQVPTSSKLSRVV